MKRQRKFCTFIWISFLFFRQDTHSSSAVPTRPTPMPVSSRSPRSSCCCWTVCGSCGVSSPWHWASLRRCSWGWRLRPTRPTTAPSCVTANGRGQSDCSWLTRKTQRFHSFKLIWTFQLTLLSQVCSRSDGEHLQFVPGPVEAPGERLLLEPPLWAHWAGNLALSPPSVPAALER